MVNGVYIFLGLLLFFGSALVLIVKLYESKSKSIGCPFSIGDYVRVRGSEGLDNMTVLAYEPNHGDYSVRLSNDSTGFNHWELASRLEYVTRPIKPEPS